MANQDDFTIVETDAPSDDFSLSNTPGIIPVNRGSNVNMAASSAMLSSEPDQVLNKYDEVLGALEDDESRAAVDHVFQTTQSQQHAASRLALTDLLSDPTVSDEVKEAAALGVADIHNEQYNIRNELSRQAIIQDDETENVPAERVRVDLSESLLEINRTKAKQQQMLNTVAARANSNTANAMREIVELYMLPFVDQKFSKQVADQFLGGDESSWWDNLFPGTAKKNIRKALESMPDAERLAMTEKLVDIVKDSSNLIVLTGENDFAQVEFLRSIIEDGHYGEVDAWIDNAVSVLDLVGLGAVTKSALKSTFKRFVKAGSQPASVTSNLKDTNPSKYRESVEAIAESNGDEVAEQLAGTSRNEAVADVATPEMHEAGEKIVHKPSTPNHLSEMRETDPGELLDLLGRNGYTHFTEAEKRSARSKVTNDFNHVEGMKPRSEMNTVEATDQGVKIQGVYGPSKSGYTRPDTAVKAAERSLRDYGLKEGEGITLLRRDGEGYVETDLATEMKDIQAIEELKAVNPDINIKLKRQQDYLIKLDFEYKFDADDVGFEPLGVKRNLIDQLGLGLSDKFGSFQRHLFDPASMLDQTIWKSGNVAVDKSAEMERRLLDLASDFADDFVKYDKADQAKMFDLIKKANDESKEITHVDMVNADLTEAQMGTMKAWKRYWDVQYVLENQDAGKTLRSRGFQEFVEESSGTKLFAKPVSRAQVGARSRIYDPVTDEVKSMSVDQIDELYDQGGTIARTKLPLELDESVDLIVATNRSDGGYLRAITDSTQVLNYRNGYFTRRYKSPYFIDKTVKDAQGNVLYTRAVATSENISDAQRKADELTAQEDGLSTYKARPDERGQGFDDFDNFWGVEQAKGRTTQRIRGKRLEDANAAVDDLAHAPIEGPVDSMLLQARSISHRIPMREVIEAHKRRALQQYSDYFPPNDFGAPRWPTSSKEIRNYGEANDSMKTAGDARTTFEYINYLENGYINAIDDGFKAMLKSIAQKTGEKGWKPAEKALNWASNTRGPTAMGKNAAFNLYLAANPFRQFVIQSHQAVQLAANYGDWLFSGRMVPEIMTLLSHQAGIKPSKKALKSLGMTEEEGLALFKDWKSSGLSASIDKQNLVRGALADLADEMADSSLRRGVNKVTAPLRISRKLGFDSGEYVNLMTAWLANRYRAVKNGQDVSQASVLDDISAKARNYTYNMNAAGDMPYNQNALALIFQFMQVPHKAMTTMLTNRGLKGWEKARLAGFNGVMYTLPPAMIYELFGHMLPEDPVAQDFIVNGAEGAIYNYLLSGLFGEDVRINWQGLAPIDMHGQLEMMTELVTSDVGTILANTPSGSLLFGRNPRIANFLGTVARATNVVDDFSEPTTFSDVAYDAANLFSGMSNAFKASYMMEYQKKLSAFGGVTDSNVRSGEAFMQVFGFPTMDSAQKYWINNKSYEKSQDFEKDVTEWWNSYRRHITKKGITPDEVEWVTKAHSEGWRVWGNDNRRAKKILDGLIRRDLRTSYDTYSALLQSHSIFSTEELRVMIEQIPDVSDSDRTKMLNTLNEIDRLKGEL